MKLPGRLMLAVLLFALLGAGICAQTRRGRRSPRQAPPPPASPSASPSATPSPQIIRDHPWQIESVTPSEAVRGEQVTVTGNFPPKPSELEVLLNRADLPPQPANTNAPTPTPTPTPTYASTKMTARPAVVRMAADGKSLTFVVPPDARLGDYYVVVNLGEPGKKYAPVIFYGGQSGPFRVVTREAVKLSAIYPEINYTEEEKTFSFTILGDGFSRFPEDNTLILEGRPGFEVCSEEQKPAEENKPRDCATVRVQSPTQLEIRDIPYERFGPLKIRVKVGNQVSKEALPVTLSWVKKRTPLTIAAAFVVVLALLVYFILSGRKWGRVRRRRYTLLEAIFLDRETNTYSLSKLQFYAWTLAGIFGYVYLTAAYSLIQKNLTFPPIPENLPSLLLISVSTSALATGISNQKGPKGAGEEHPSMADFITSGGVVAAERLQFFVWTIVGVLGFIFLMLSIDPGLIQALPKIPDSFLYLMGVSSFGYLGGKLARKPGPVITQVVAQGNSLSLEIHGRALSPDATFRIDDVDILANQLDSVVNENGRPKVEVPDEQPEYAKVLRLVLKQFRPEWLSGEHKLLLTNPDGQKAEWAFQAVRNEQPAAPGAASPTITAINPDFGALGGGESVTISGTNFASGASVTFGGTPAPRVLVDSPTSLTATTPQRAQDETVDVTVTNADGKSANAPNGFTYTSEGG